MLTRLYTTPVSYLKLLRMEAIYTKKTVTKTNVIPIPPPTDPCERETVIQYDNASGDATVYTFDVKIHTYLTRLGVEPTETFTINGKEAAWTFIVPKRWVRVRRPKQMKKKDGGGDVE